MGFLDKNPGGYLGYKDSDNYGKSGIFSLQNASELISKNFWHSKITTDGLILNIDFTNINSYPKSGETCYSDVSNRTYVIENASYTDAFSGSLLCNGSTSKLIHESDFTIQNTFSYELWCMPNLTHEIDTEANSGASGTGGQRYIIGATNKLGIAGAGVSVGTNGVSVYEHAPNYMPATLVYSSTISSTRMTHIMVVYINKVPSLYVNGVFVKTGVISGVGTVETSGRDFSYGDYGTFSGHIGQIRIYNRALTANEVLINFNAHKEIYGV